MEHEVTMRECIETLGLSNVYNITDTSSNNICPVCGDPNSPRKKKLNINFQKGVFRCNKCGFHGGILDLWAYHRNLHGDSKDAYKDFLQCYQEKNGTVRSRVKFAPPQKIAEEPVDPDKVDRTYTAFLEALYLSDKHRENLRKRGHSDAGIEAGMYRTLPQGAVRAIPAKLIKAGFDLHGVPGFYTVNGEWRFVRYGNGFLIPSRDTEGRIRAVQLRLDTGSEDGKRYFTVSTDGYENGTKGTAAPHFVPGRRGLRTVVITEGPLKGNIISDITGYPVLAVLGVNTLGRLPEMLQTLFQRGTRQIKVAYDMDYIENPNVREACDHLEKMLIRMGFRYTRVIWDPGEKGEDGHPYKGLDDYLAK